MPRKMVFPHYVALRLDDVVMAQVKQIAWDDRRTLSEIIRTALIAYLGQSGLGEGDASSKK